MCLGRRSWVWQKRAIVVGAALILGWASLPRAPTGVHVTQHFTGVRPDALAHHLADFSNHVLFYPNLKSWVIESEWSNFTSWHYDVSYACGARCTGRSVVTASRAQEAGEASVLRHGPAPRHRVLALHVHCTRLLSLLPWPAACEETETEALIVGGGVTAVERAELSESTRASCSPLAALLVGTRCAGVDELRARRRRQLHALSAAMAT